MASANVFVLSITSTPAGSNASGGPTYPSAAGLTCGTGTTSCIHTLSDPGA